MSRKDDVIRAVNLIVPAELRTPASEKAARSQKPSDPNIIPGGPFVLDFVAGRVRKATPSEVAQYKAGTRTAADVLSKEQAKAKREKLELAMVQQLKALGLIGGLVPQHLFHVKRRWRLDFAWPAKRIALEVDGGTHTGGRHVRGDGYAKDCEKHAQAMLMGYRVFRATAEQVKDGTAVRWIEQALIGVHE